jgi:hypothetical protein
VLPTGRKKTLEYWAANWVPPSPTHYEVLINFKKNLNSPYLDKIMLWHVTKNRAQFLFFFCFPL